MSHSTETGAPVDSDTFRPTDGAREPASVSSRILAQGKYETLAMLKNGEQLDQSGNTMPVAKMEPRTAIGVSQDGKEVYLMVVDGRNFYYSNGADLLDLMNLMSACGASDALNLDGGGSSTFIARDGAEGELKLLNWPTDQGGVMRKVATGLAIVEQ